jgi:putative SOS response-associated peptidase YedK
MCGRYFWTHDAEDALEEDFPELVGQILQQADSLRAGDYTPAMKAMALVGGASSGPASETGSIASGNANGSLADITGRESSSPRRELTPQVLQWGFPGFDKGKLLINARAESVKDRPTFRGSFEQGRCVLPAAGFYEWDKSKEKVTFTVPDKPILYLAGIWRPYGPEQRFVILTREANASMSPVHDRMPLILTKEEVEPWVSERAEAERLLVKELPMLKAERPYEQLMFEW